MTLLALNCRGNPAAVPGPGLFSSAPESRAFQCWFGVGTPDQEASLCNSLALHTGEVHMPISGWSCSGLVWSWANLERGLISWEDSLSVLCVCREGVCSTKHPNHILSFSSGCSSMLAGFPCWAPDFGRSWSEKGETVKCAYFSPCLYRVSFLSWVTRKGGWVQTKSRWPAVFCWSCWHTKELIRYTCYLHTVLWFERTM